jgi:anti-sigma factor RsiW
MYMMHKEIEDQEIIERYARNQLPPEDRLAFEEHFFGCEECFGKLQATERFIAGIRDAGSRGLLEGNPSADATPARRWGGWMFPALAASSCAAVGLAVAAVWTFFFQIPRLHHQLNQTSLEINAQREAIATLQKQVASSVQAETNVPLVILQATRDAQAQPNDAVLSADAKHLTLWIELPSSASGSFLLGIATADGRNIQTLENLKRNTYGALVVSLPADVLQSGIYTVKLSRQEPSPVTLVAEYRLRIRRP